MIFIEYLLKGNLLYKIGHPYVPRGEHQRNLIYNGNYRKIACHIEVNNYNIIVIKIYLYYISLKLDVDRYIKLYIVCAITKTLYGWSGLYKPFPIPIWSWYFIYMAYTIGYPINKKKDNAILFLFIDY